MTSLIPLVLQAGLNTGRELSILGTDYDTPDGTAIRDYIHVSDLASAHVAALDYLKNGGTSGSFNLGTGRGYSVRDVIETTGRILGREIQAVECPRRLGDVEAMVADAHKAASVLKWTPTHSSLEEIIATGAAWERMRKSG